MVKPELKARVLRAAAIFRRHKVLQADVAAAVGASQPQVSRILNARGLRATRLYEEICLYAERLENGVTADAVRANDDLINALKDIWDGSDSHAKAIAVVIRSLATFRARSGG